MPVLQPRPAVRDTEENRLAVRQFLDAGEHLARTVRAFPAVARELGPAAAIDVLAAQRERYRRWGRALVAAGFLTAAELTRLEPGEPNHDRRRRG